MPSRTPRHLHRSPAQDPEEPDDETPLPVDPDEGLIPAMIPDDPEYDRVVEPQD